MSGIFEAYKNLLKKESANNTIRFIVIEYLCFYPNLDPFMMAKCLVLDGYKIIFDDHSIGKLQNDIKKKKVYG